MPKNVIIEGVECAGKTTLIEELSRHLSGWDIKYLPHREGNQFQRYAQEYLNNERTIFNRSHLSEVVCGEMWRNGPGMTEGELAALNNMISQEFLVIFADADLNTLGKRFAKRNYKEKADAHELAALQEKFKRIMSQIPHVYYESRDEQALNDTVEKITNVLLEGNKK